jgi:hypothetical protein
MVDSDDWLAEMKRFELAVPLCVCKTTSISICTVRPQRRAVPEMLPCSQSLKARERAASLKHKSIVVKCKGPTGESTAPSRSMLRTIGCRRSWRRGE